MMPEELERERERRIAYLFGRLEPIMEEVHRIYRPGRFILLQMIENGKGMRLVHQADALLNELAPLLGEKYTPLPKRLRAHPPGHPMAYLAAQWLLGIYNSFNTVSFALDGRWWFAGLNLLGVIACQFWRVPPYRLARQGKWHA